MKQEVQGDHIVGGVGQASRGHGCVSRARSACALGVRVKELDLGEVLLGHGPRVKWTRVDDFTKSFTRKGLESKHSNAFDRFEAEGQEVWTQILRSSFVCA